jgi:hypothetical protein
LPAIKAQTAAGESIIINKKGNLKTKENITFLMELMYSLSFFELELLLKELKLGNLTAIYGEEKILELGL